MRSLANTVLTGIYIEHRDVAWALELALLNEAETAARFQLILDCMKLGGGTPELREELAFLARQRARLKAEMESARERQR
ncbi:MAG: hypothetical protein DWI11_09535 [Planctomycetota bacterium]|nr:MAG: hypothetical protein DWI11_09535 [Planctomycetota bacterium]